MSGFRPLGQEFIEGALIEKRMKAFEHEATTRTDDEHMWVFTMMHTLTEDQARTARGGQVMSGIMDHETLVMAGGPICWRCETEIYTTEPCSGYRT